MAIVDDHGRVRIPRILRERYGLRPGAPVIIEAEEDCVTVRLAVPRHEALGRLAGVIPKSTGTPSTEAVDAKRIWSRSDETP